MSMAHVAELVDGYLLGALEPDESSQVTAHLASCATCLRTLEETREVLSALPAQLEPLSPRPALKVALLAAARADASGAHGGANGETRPPRLLPFRMDPASANKMLRWASVGMAAAFIIGVVGGLAGWALVLGDRLDKRKDDLANNHDALETLVHSDDVLRFESTYAGTNIKAVIAAANTGTGALIIVSDVPTATGGTGYHLWLFANGVAESNGVLAPDANGDIITRVNVDLSRYDRMEIDLQPVGASAPGGERVIATNLR